MDVLVLIHRDIYIFIHITSTCEIHRCKLLRQRNGMFIRTGVFVSCSLVGHDLIQITKYLFSLNCITMKEFRRAGCMSILVEFRELLAAMKLQSTSQSDLYIITFKDSCGNAPLSGQIFPNKYTHILPQLFERILSR